MADELPPIRSAAIAGLISATAIHPPEGTLPPPIHGSSISRAAHTAMVIERQIQRIDTEIETVYCINNLRKEVQSHKRKRENAEKELVEVTRAKEVKERQCKEAEEKAQQLAQQLADLKEVQQMRLLWATAKGVDREVYIAANGKEITVTEPRY